MPRAQFFRAFTTIFLIMTTVDAQPANLGTVPQLQIELRLHDAVFPTDNPNGERSPANFLLRRSGDNWLALRPTRRWKGRSRGRFATSQDESVDLLFVGTVGRGAHPEILTSGRGIDAVVAVGARQVRCDEGRIVFEAVSSAE